MTRWQDIGSDVKIQMQTDTLGRFVGLRYAHPNAKTGDECMGTIYFDKSWVRADPLLSGVAKWRVDSWEPLTVAESLLCSCGHHGFIREGVWVSAGEIVKMKVTNSSRPPGTDGTVGPFEAEYSDPHVYARDVNSGSGNCVCGATLTDELHTEAAPGVPIPGREE